MIADKLRKLSLPDTGQVTTLSPASVSFASIAREFIDSVNGNNYFGPNQPTRPEAPAGTLPRAFDYNFGVNMMMQPRTEHPGLPSFSQLRSLADNCDLLREVIEHRKKEIVKVPWVIRPKSDPVTYLSMSPGSENISKATYAKIRTLTEFFERPDRQRDWTTWLSMVLEEVFVIDALSIWPMYDTGGALRALNVVDGATIKPLHDEQGWSPNPPNPGYQQFIKGMPSVNMTAGFCDICTNFRSRGLNPPNHFDGTGPCSPLIYQPRNPRVNKFYGFSPVEWIIKTILLAINRQMSQISYYTEGNVPEMIVQAPSAWNKSQIEEFQQFVDTKAGDIAARRRMWFVPETKGILQTKDKMLTDKMDEWLARVFCFAFGVSPQPFSSMMNRATAQVASQSSAEEGTIPELNYVKCLINYVIRYCFFADDVEFVWKTELESDQLKQMRIDTGYSKVGVIGIDEVRTNRLGLHPIGIGNIIVTNNGAVSLSKEMLDAQQKALENTSQEVEDGGNEDKNNDAAGAKVPVSGSDSGSRSKTNSTRRGRKKSRGKA